MLEKPVFIVGLHRTGSTLVKNMLDLNSQLAMLPEELHLWDPYPWANVFIDKCKKMKLTENSEREKIFDMIFSKKFYGSFWKKIDEYPIDRKRVIRKLNEIGNTITCKDIINIIFLEYLTNENKRRIGVKYPLHIKKIDLLTEWYPDCKIVHLTRDCRAIYASKIKDEFSRSMKTRFHFFSVFLDIFTLVRVIVEYNWSKLIHIYHRNENNYYLLKYEELVSDPLNVLHKLCNFLDIPFESDMLYPSGKPSSYTHTVKTGFDKERACAWKGHIKWWEESIINIFASPSLRIFGYEV